MTNKAPGKPAPEGGGLNLGEIYYVLFRRKWLILLLSLAGIGVAAWLRISTPPTYQSEAKLLVRYILETKGFEPGTGGDQARSPDSGGASIINSEIEILTSQDIARQVAESVGPDKILPKGFENPNPDAAAVLIGRNLLVTSQRYNSVIQIAFQHTDAGIAQQVLQQLVKAYLETHIKFHRGGVVSDYLTQQRDKYRADLAKTEDELRTLMQGNSMISVEERRGALLDEVFRLRQELHTFEAELVERQTLLKSLHVDAGSLPATNEIVVKQEVPAEKMEEYRGVVLQLDAFRKRERDLLTQFTEGNSMVKKTRQLVAETEQAKIKLEQEFPALKRVNVETASTRPEKTVDLSTEVARTSALLAKVELRRKQLAVAQTNLTNIELLEPRIKRLQDQREQESANLRGVQASLDRSTGDTTVGASGISNISVVQKPIPGMPTTSKLMKKIGMALAAGIGGGIGLAFLIELILRQSIRHASQVEKKLGLPLFLSIPKFGRNGSSRSRRAQRTQAFRRNGAGSAGGAAADAGSAPAAGGVVAAVSSGGADLAVAPWDGSDQLRSYYEALRDRLITFFEVRNMTHKPKLVAVTGCSKGAGVSSVAAGLAATLSETGDGNVLLVDMNLEHGAAHPFYRGKPAAGLTDALDAGDRQPAQVQDNLYMVSASVMNDLLPKALPKRFASLVPRFKASDYDYIIFDMPPVTQTSLTPRLSSYMDMVLLVIEAEKTNLGVADKAVELLRESRANVAAVINRKRKYVPSWLLEEF